MTYPEAQAEMSRQLYRLIFGGNSDSMTIGELILKAKAAVKDADVRRTWVLLGDPTMKLR